MDIEIAQGKALVTDYRWKTRTPEELARINRELDELLKADAIVSLGPNEAEKEELKETLLLHINLADWFDSLTSLKEMKDQLKQFITSGKRFLKAMDDLHSDGWRLVESEIFSKRNLKHFAKDGSVVSYVLGMETFIKMLVAEAEAVRESLPAGEGGAPDLMLKRRLIKHLVGHYRCITGNDYKAGKHVSREGEGFDGPGFLFIKACLEGVGFLPVTDIVLYRMILKSKEQ